MRQRCAVVEIEGAKDYDGVLYAGQPLLLLVDQWRLLNSIPPGTPIVPPDWESKASLSKPIVCAKYVGQYATRR